MREDTIYTNLIITVLMFFRPPYVLEGITWLELLSLFQLFLVLKASVKEQLHILLWLKTIIEEMGFPAHSEYMAVLAEQTWSCLNLNFVSQVKGCICKQQNIVSLQYTSFLRIFLGSLLPLSLSVLDFIFYATISCPPPVLLGCGY